MGHHVDPASKRIYVDTAFLNNFRGVPGVTLEHMGFGEFYFKTPKGRVEIDRGRGKPFEGMSGRPHWMYDAEGGSAISEWLVDLAEKKEMSSRVARRYASMSFQ